MKSKTIVLVLALIYSALLLPISAWSQTCKETIKATAADANFTPNGNGTVADNTTGLMWMRCSIGQEWDGKACNGDARTFRWADALKAAAGYKFAGYTNWRLPNKNELESISEGRCFSPAINSYAFPSTPPGYFWSSSPYAGMVTAAWSIDFGYGTVNATVKSGTLYIRLVRNSDL